MKPFETTCLTCKKTFLRKLQGRRLCNTCLTTYVAEQGRRERQSMLTPAQLEQRMQQIVNDELAMPWERKKKQ